MFPPFCNQKQSHFHLRLCVKIAIMLWTCSSSRPANLLSTLACVSNPGAFLPVWASTTSALFNSLPIMKVHRKRTASMWMPLCITHSWGIPSTLQEFIHIAHNMFWIVLKCVLSIVPYQSTCEIHERVSRMEQPWWWAGGAGADCRGLKHLLHITITDFDQCLH